LRSCAAPLPHDEGSPPPQEGREAEIFDVKSDDDWLEAWVGAARGESEAWDRLLGPDTHLHLVEIPDHDEVEEIAPASTEDQLLGAHAELERGSIRKASNELTSWGKAPDTAFVRKQLREMNPSPMEEFQNTSDVTFDEWNIPPSRIKKELFRMPSDTAPGPSGVTVEHLKKLSATEEGMNSLSTIINRIINGQEVNWKRLTAARLVPLVKTRSKVRPIAIGETVTRLAGKVLLQHQKRELSEFLKPLQWGVKEPGATEKVAHAIRKQFYAGKGVLTLDIRNAFNSISREKVRQVLKRNLPGILPYFEWAYQHASPLYFQGDLLAFSREGVRQGDPLGPALFAVGIQEVLEQLSHEFPAVHIHAYLDDVSAAGECDDLVAFANRFSELAASCGLVVNTSKSELLLPLNNPLPQSAHNLQLKRDGLVVLGTPIGVREFEEEWCLSRVQEMKKLLMVKSGIGVPVQCRYILLRESIIPALNHLLRTVPPSHRKDATEEFDNTVREVARSLLGTDYFQDEEEFENSFQWRFPLRYGGLGLVPVSMVSLPAYVASVWEAGTGFEDRERSSLVQDLREQDVDISEDDLRKQAPNRKQQKSLVDQVVRGSFTRFFRGQQEDVKARIKAAQQVGAHDWLRALPTSSTKRFSDLQWRMGVRLRLGLPLTSQPLPGFCPLCDSLIDDVGSHAFKCAYGDIHNVRVDRHNQIRDTLAGGLASWGFPVKREPLIKTGSGHRGDVEIVQSDCPVIVDVSITHPSAVSTQQNLRTAAATRVVELMKTNKYGSVCRDLGKKLIPFAFQSYGGIGEDAIDFLSQLKHRPASLYVFHPKRYVECLREGLSCRLMRSNVNLLCRWLQLVLPRKNGGVAVYASNTG
jgi:hypothetical protein